MPARPVNVAVLGATGATGRALVQALEDGALSVSSLRLLASEHGAGAELEFRGEAHRVAPVRAGAFDGCHVAFFAAGAVAARAWAGPAWKAGCAVVDLSPAFRGDADVPLVLPQLRGEAVSALPARGIVAIPGPSAAQLALVLAPLRAAAGVERVVVTSCQAASGAGQPAVEALEGELRAMLSFQEPPPPSALPHRLAFNLVPQVGAFGGHAATDEEREIVADIRRLLGPRPPRVSVTCVQVPVFYAHSQFVSLRTARPLPAADARALLARAAGVKVLDQPAEGVYPMPMLAVNDDAVLVGRIRDDESEENGLQLVVAGDNLRQGGATTAVAVAASLAEHLLAAR